MNLINSFVQLPAELQNLILVGATLLVGYVFAQLSGLYSPLDVWLAEHKASTSVTLAGIVVAFLQGYLNQIPFEWETVGTLALQLVVAVLAALKVIELARDKGIKGFRNL